MGVDQLFGISADGTHLLAVWNVDGLLFDVAAVEAHLVLELPLR